MTEHIITKKAIGWDIGIKNLAYCVLDSCVDKDSKNAFLFNKNYYDIAYWADISLVYQIETNLQLSGQVSHINNTITCCADTNQQKKTKTKTNTNTNANTNTNTNANTNTDEVSIMKDNINVCGKTATYANEELTIDGLYTGLCKTHFKKSKIIRLPELLVKKCWASGCASKPIQVLRVHKFKGFCKKHLNEMKNAKTHIDADFFKINHAKTTAKIDINHLGIALFQELRKIKDIITKPDIILLENQPVLKNPTMKSMQMFLYSFYLMSIIDTGIDLSNIDVSKKQLQCYCASKKLDLIKFIEEGEQTRIMEIIDKVKNPYQKNKKMSVLIVEVLLKSNTKWLAYFKNHPKQDDLADSLLMTLHYFEKKLIVSTTTQTERKINKINKINKEENTQLE